MPFLDPTLAPTSRQEASGNTADAARRTGYAELYDPRSPETIERRRDSLNRLERAGPFNPPGNADFAPDHDIP